MDDMQNQITIAISGSEGISEADTVRQYGVYAVGQASFDGSTLAINMQTDDPNIISLQLLASIIKSAKAVNIQTSLCPSAKGALDRFTQINLDEVAQ